MCHGSIIQHKLISHSCQLVIEQTKHMECTMGLYFDLKLLLHIHECVIEVNTVRLSNHSCLEFCSPASGAGPI